MKKASPWLSVLVLLSTCFAWLAAPLPAQAALVISGVEPAIISTSSSARISIYGSDFSTASEVVLANYGLLSSSFVSAGELRADVPVGLPLGTYALRVNNADGAWYELPNGLTVALPTAAPHQDVTTTPTTPAVSPAERPLVVVDAYNYGSSEIKPGQEFNLVVKLKNVGQREAVNIVAEFTPGDFVPRVSGGVLAMTSLDPGDERKFNQPLTATNELAGKATGAVVMTLTYTDADGVSYSGTFNLTLRVTPPRYGPVATATPTPTAAPRPRPQLLITSYQTDVEMLKPGIPFSLNLKARNVGNGLAKGVTMILGGGSSSSGGAAGTPEAGGISGGGGEFGNFAPVAASNVQFLGDLAALDDLNASARLIVNTKTEPGAYPMKISFSYTAESGQTYTDDQVITLLVFSPPLVDVNFYRDPGSLYAGQENLLPLQVVNLGRKAAILGNMRVTAQGAQLTNNTTLVGALDTGGYYTLDAGLMPDLPGSLELLVTIDYTDDFNQPQVISKTLMVEIQEMPVFEPPVDGGEGGEPLPVDQPETFWQKLLRLLKGLVGLDSAKPTQAPLDGVPGEPLPETDPGGIPVPRPGPKG